MINPNSLEVWHQKFTSRAHGTKFYRACFEAGSFSKVSRKQFKTATEASVYAVAVVERWKRLYDAAILSMLPAQEPAP